MTRFLFQFLILASVILVAGWFGNKYIYGTPDDKVFTQIKLLGEKALRLIKSSQEDKYARMLSLVDEQIAAIEKKTASGFKRDESLSQKIADLKIHRERLANMIAALKEKQKIAETSDGLMMQALPSSLKVSEPVEKSSKIRDEVQEFEEAMMSLVAELEEN